MAILHTFPSHYNFSATIWDTEGDPNIHDVQEYACVNGSSFENTAAPSQNSRRVINLQAAVHKVNAKWLSLLRQIAANVGRLITLRFFPNMHRKYSSATAGPLDSCTSEPFVQCFATFADAWSLQLHLLRIYRMHSKAHGGMGT